MRRVALVSGHFAPSNLVGAHRARLWSRYLPEFGWEPIVVTGDPAHYEERPDPDLERLVAPGLEVVHAATVSSLPFHHRDPFDRLLVSQAIVERIPLVSDDAALDAYSIRRLW